MDAPVGLRQARRWTIKGRHGSSEPGEQDHRCSARPILSFVKPPRLRQPLPRRDLGSPNGETARIETSSATFGPMRTGRP